MSELSQESSRSNKDGNRRVTVAYFSTGAQEEIAQERALYGRRGEY